MKTVKFALAVLLAIVIGVLAFANGGDVTVTFWPDLTDYGLPASPAYELPLFFVGLVCAVAGFMAGVAREYLREGGVRSRARKARAEAAKLKARVEELSPDDDDIPALTAR